MNWQQGDRVVVAWERRRLYGHVTKVDEEHGRVMVQCKTAQYATMRRWFPVNQVWVDER